MSGHDWDHGVVLEVLAGGRQVGPGESGEVVITPFYSLAMPLVRYALGDVVTVGDSPCPCGAPFSTIRAVQGRTLDYFPLADGRLLHPYELAARLGPRVTVRVELVAEIGLEPSGSACRARWWPPTMDERGRVGASGRLSQLGGVARDRGKDCVTDPGGPAAPP